MFERFKILGPLAAAGAVLVSAGCAATHADQAVQDRTVPPFQNRSLSTVPAPGVSSESALDPPLSIPAGEVVLVPAMSGTGNGATASFPIDKGLFTVRISCAGGASVRASVDGSDYPVDCSEAPRRINVATESPRAAVQIAAAPEVRWTVAVVVGTEISYVPS